MKALWTTKEVRGLLNDMKMYYMDGELEKGSHLLSINIYKDSAGEEGYVFSWDLYKQKKKPGKLIPISLIPISGEAFLYSEDSLMESLIDHGVIVKKLPGHKNSQKSNI